MTGALNGQGAARLGVDIGGTFTDLALAAGERLHTLKLLTTHEAPERAVLAGLDAILAEAGLPPSAIGLTIHGTTLATNALIERKGALTALVTTEGFRDTLEIGTESRFEQYDLFLDKPPPLVPRRLRLPVPERVAADGRVLLPLDEEAVAALVPRLRAEGVEAIAVGFLHSFVNPAHEEQAAAILARALPGVPVTLSCRVSPEMREYERFSTACANAYVQPRMSAYLGRLERALQARGLPGPLFLMLSGGGITDVATAARFPIRLVESGPAGGAVFAARVAAAGGLEQVLSLDMGGTTAKICLIDGGRPQTARSFEVARMHRFLKGSGLPIRIPVIEMVEIGAGGGSIAAVDALGRIAVGPESAGSEPGPACYGRGGTAPTVTDADLVLGRIDAAGFSGGRLPLDAGAAEAALSRAVGDRLGLAPPLAAFGVAEIVDENMANAARVHAIESGKALGGRTLIAFGGAAPLHAARIAAKLGIDRVIVPPHAGVGSAVGFLEAPVAYEVVRSRYVRLGALEPAGIEAMLGGMAEEAERIVAAGAPGATLRRARLAYMRYVGQGHEIAVTLPEGPLGEDAAAAIRAAFEAAYRTLYRRTMATIEIEILSWAVTVAAEQAWRAPPAGAGAAGGDGAAGRRAAFDPVARGFAEAPVHRRADLAAGARIPGPAMIDEAETTIVVTAGFTASLDEAGNLLLTREGAP
ncbi:MAG: hydantoinase/oxoprolinase family protein [Dongiaceae bacterium]